MSKKRRKEVAGRIMQGINPELHSKKMMKAVIDFVEPIRNAYIDKLCETLDALKERNFDDEDLRLVLRTVLDSSMASIIAHSCRTSYMAAYPVGMSRSEQIESFGRVCRKGITVGLEKADEILHAEEDK